MTNIINFKDYNLNIKPKAEKRMIDADKVLGLLVKVAELEACQSFETLTVLVSLFATIAGNIDELK